MEGRRQTAFRAPEHLSLVRSQLHIPAIFGAGRYRERRSHPASSGHDIHGISWKLTPVRGDATTNGGRWQARAVRRYRFRPKTNTIPLTPYGGGPVEPCPGSTARANALT